MELLPQVNIVVAITALAGIGGLVGYLIKPVLQINGELRQEYGRLQAQHEAQEKRVALLEDLVTSRAAVDELAGYVADWRDEARQRDAKIITALDRIAVKLGAT